MKTHPIRILSIGTAAMLLASGAARADYAPFQGYVEMPQVMAPMITGNLASENLRLLNEQNARGGSARPKPPVSAGSILVPAQPSSNTPRRMAARYPAAQRAQIESVFRDTLTSYHQLEDKLGIDLAGAVAAYVAGSYMAYRDVTLPDEQFKLLVEQMRGILAANPAVQRASGAEKRDLYEEMAIAGMFIAVVRESLKRNAAQAQYASNVLETAKANLEQFLKTDADRVQITDHGLVIR
jgi:hypothetical protein